MNIDRLNDVVGIIKHQIDGLPSQEEKDEVRKFVEEYTYQEDKPTKYFVLWKTGIIIMIVLAIGTTLYRVYDYGYRQALREMPHTILPQDSVHAKMIIQNI